MRNIKENIFIIVQVSIALLIASLACNTLLPGSSDTPTEIPSSSTEISESGVPDLVISKGHAGMDVSGGCVEAYGPITSEVCVKNQGTAAAHAFQIAVSDGTNWAVSGLGSGETACFESELNLSAQTITADANNQVMESDEGNNVWTIPSPTPPVLCSPTEALPPQEPDVSYQGVSFSYDPILASEVRPINVPGEVGAAVEAWNTPDSLEFIFDDYLSQYNLHTPMILIFRTDDYNAVNPTAGDVIHQLKQFLQEQPTDPEDIPLLPIWNAAQFMQAQVKYFRFQNGSGVRYITQYGQAAWPINGEDMFYTYQGITDDEIFYISAVFPLSHPSLPDPETITLDDAFYDNFMTYVEEIEDQLNAEAPGSFFPTFMILDAVIESLLVTGPS